MLHRYRQRINKVDISMRFFSYWMRPRPAHIFQDIRWQLSRRLTTNILRRIVADAGCIWFRPRNSYFAHGSDARYCYEYVCPRTNLVETTPPNFTKFYVHVACGRGWFFTGGVAISHVLPVLWMTSSLHIMGPMARYGYSYKWHGDSLRENLKKN